MNPVNAVLVVYALLNIGLGAYGFASKHSVVSMIAGTAIGLLVLGSIWLTGTNPRAGRIMALVVAVLTIGAMAKDLAQMKWHAIILVVASLIAIGVLLGGHMAAMARKTQKES